MPRFSRLQLQICRANEKRLAVWITDTWEKFETQ